MKKVFVAAKRARHISASEMKDYYESSHIKMTRHFPEMTRHIRRYVTEVWPDIATGLEQELGFDVIAEMWFRDEAALARAMAEVRPETIAAIVADEKNLFDRDTVRMFCVDEIETNLPI